MPSCTCGYFSKPECPNRPWLRSPPAGRVSLTNGHASLLVACPAGWPNSGAIDNSLAQRAAGANATQTAPSSRLRKQPRSWKTPTFGLAILTQLETKAHWVAAGHRPTPTIQLTLFRCMSCFSGRMQVMENARRSLDLHRLAPLHLAQIFPLTSCWPGCLRELPESILFRDTLRISRHYFMCCMGRPFKGNMPTLLKTHRRCLCLG